MSGIEIIGLLFGALTLIEPIAKGVKSASTIAKGSASYRDYIHDTSLEYHSHAQIFRNESRRIFGCFMTETQIDQIFGYNGLKDPRWQDDNWKNDVRDYLGVFYKGVSLAMELVFRTLSLLNEDIIRLTELEDLPSPGETPSCRIHTSTSCNCEQESIPIKIKSKLVQRKKSIKEHFENLHRHNMSYRVAVGEFLEDQKWRTKATTQLMKRDNRRFKNKSPLTIPWTSVAQVIDDLHEAARRLSSALQNAATCSCHSFHLRLEMVSSKDLSIPLSGPLTCINRKDPRVQALQFNLITIGYGKETSQVANCGSMVVDNLTQQLDRLSLRIEFKPRAKPKRISSTLNRTDFEAPNLPSCLKLPVSLGQHISQHTETQRIDTVLASTAAAKDSKFKRSVAFARNSLLSAIPSTSNRKRKGVHFNSNPHVKPFIEEDENIDEVSNQKTIISEEISDLCAWLQRLRNPDTQNEGHRAGVLTVDEEVECVIYENQIDLGCNSGIGTKKYESLLNYLSSGRDVLSTTQRLELAHTLAISLLRLHSSSWIDRSWSSKDVMLLLPPDASEAEREWSSYVAAAFNDIAKIQQIAQAENPGKSGYKLSYVVSLGIIFLEIGLSRSLSDHDGATENIQDLHFDAYMKACAEVKFHSVMCMGPTYDRVVEICVKWIDSDELDDEIVRRKFYEEVVLGLERCIKVANSSSERRRRRTREYSRSPEHHGAASE